MLRSKIIGIVVLFSGAVHAETIPTIKINDYVVKKEYVDLYTSYISASSPQALCAKIGSGYVWDGVKKGCYWQGKHDQERLIEVWGYRASEGFASAMYKNGDPVFNLKPTEHCPAGYRMQTMVFNKTCHRPDDGCDRNTKTIQEHKLLAAIVHGESTDGTSYEEMQGIASATIRRKEAAKASTVNSLIDKFKNYTYVICDGNDLYNKLLCSKDPVKYQKAYDAAKSAMDKTEDFSNGGCFWDGKDLKTKGENHQTYKYGFKFSDPSHNIFGVKEPPPKHIKGERGYYDYVYISTAAVGNTIFWKVSDEYIKAQGARQCV